MFRKNVDGTLLQLFPLHKDIYDELTAAGDIDVEGKLAIWFGNACSIVIDGVSPSIPIQAGDVFAINCKTLTLDVAIVYGLV